MLVTGQATYMKTRQLSYRDKRRQLITCMMIKNTAVSVRYIKIKGQHESHSPNHRVQSVFLDRPNVK